MVAIVAIHQPRPEEPDLGYRKKLVAIVQEDCPEASMFRGDAYAILDAQRIERLDPAPTEESLRQQAGTDPEGSWTLLWDRPINHAIEVAT
jgi:hypothetical protein